MGNGAPLAAADMTRRPDAVVYGRGALVAPEGGSDCDKAIEAIEARLAAFAAGFGAGGGPMFGLAGPCFPACVWLRETREPLKAGG